MARNMVQFQKGMSLPTFLEKFGTEEACRKALFGMAFTAPSAGIIAIVSSSPEHSFSVIAAIIRPR